MSNNNMNKKDNLVQCLHEYSPRQRMSNNNIKVVNNRRYALPGTFEHLIWIVPLCFFCLIFKAGWMGIILIIVLYVSWVERQHEEYERRKKWRDRQDYLEDHPELKRELIKNGGLNYYNKFKGYWFFELMSMGYSYEEAIQIEHDMLAKNTQDFDNPEW